MASLGGATYYITKAANLGADYGSLAGVSATDWFACGLVSSFTMIAVTEGINVLAHHFERPFGGRIAAEPGY